MHPRFVDSQYVSIVGRSLQMSWPLRRRQGTYRVQGTYELFAQVGGRPGPLNDTEQGYGGGQLLWSETQC